APPHAPSRRRPLTLLTRFITTRRPPRSTRFPYTTLFRSQRSRAPWSRSSRPSSPHGETVFWRAPSTAMLCRASHSSERCGSTPRSEEHTSELQSRENLVCRLLLEKKKKRKPLKENEDSEH